MLFIYEKINLIIIIINCYTYSVIQKHYNNNNNNNNNNNKRF